MPTYELYTPVMPHFRSKVLKGVAFIVSHRFEGVAGGGTAELYFENPEGSGKTLHLIVVEVDATGQGYIDIYRDNTVSASGTSLTPVNLNHTKSTTSVVKAEYGGTYTPNELIRNIVHPGGYGVRAVGNMSELGEEIIMPEGDNILVVFTNSTASDEDVSIEILWWEE